MQNYKAIKTVGFVLGVFIVSWMPSLVFQLWIMLQQVTSVLIINWPMLSGPGSRQSRLHHQPSTRRFTVSEMESFEILYASIAIAVHVFTQQIQQISVWNQIRVKLLALGSMLSRNFLLDKVLIL